MKPRRRRRSRYSHSKIILSLHSSPCQKALLLLLLLLLLVVIVDWSFSSIATIKLDILIFKQVSAFSTPCHYFGGPQRIATKAVKEAAAAAAATSKWKLESKLHGSSVNRNDNQQQNQQQNQQNNDKLHTELTEQDLHFVTDSAKPSNNTNNNCNIICNQPREKRGKKEKTYSDPSIKSLTNLTNTTKTKVTYTNKNRSHRYDHNSRYPQSKNKIRLRTASYILSSYNNKDTDANFTLANSTSIQAFNRYLRNLSISDPQKAHQTLQHMQQSFFSSMADNSTINVNNNNIDCKHAVVCPDTASYNIVIDSWCNIASSQKQDQQEEQEQKQEENMAHPNPLPTQQQQQQSSASQMASTAEKIYAAEQAQLLLDQMEQSCQTNANSTFCPDELTYILVCQNWAQMHRIDRQGSFGLLAEKALQKMKQRFQHDHDSHKDIEMVYNIVIDGWCRRSGKFSMAMDRAMVLLSEMEQYHHQQQQIQKHTDTIVYQPFDNDDIDANTNQNRSTEQSNNNHYILFIRPNIVVYTNIISGLAQSKRNTLASDATAILDRMQQHGVEPDVVAYTSAIQCWSKTEARNDRRQACDKALELIYTMEDSYVNHKKYNLKPNLITYATAMRAIGNSFHPQAPAVAEALLRRMYTLTVSGKIHVPPTTGTFNAVINALSVSSSMSLPVSPSEQTATTKATLKKAASKNKNTTTKLKSSEQAFAEQKRANAINAEKLLLEMMERARNGEVGVEPDIKTWGGVLRAWARSGLQDAGEQAQRVLQRLLELYANGETEAKPNCVCYTTVLSAWGRSRQPDALDKVDELLLALENHYEQTLDPVLRPNKITYATVMDAYNRLSRDDAAPRAQKLVGRMLTLYEKGIGFGRPTLFIFNTLIGIWSKSTLPDAANQAEKIFRWMEDQYHNGDEHLRPDQVTLGSVLNAWANQATPYGALRAQQILDYTSSLSTEKRGFVLTAVPHNIVIKAWGRSRDKNAIERAEAILVKLENEYEQYKKQRENNQEHQSVVDVLYPDVATYSSVINCCAYPSGPEVHSKAIQVALRTYAKLQKNELLDGPNSGTFVTLFKTISITLDHNPERDSLVLKLFQKCCDIGQVDEFVLFQVRKAVSTKLYQKMVLDKCYPKINRIKGCYERTYKTFRKIPKEWRRNVVYDYEKNTK